MPSTLDLILKCNDICLPSLGLQPDTCLTRSIVAMIIDSLFIQVKLMELISSMLGLILQRYLRHLLTTIPIASNYLSLSIILKIIDTRTIQVKLLELISSMLGFILQRCLRSLLIIDILIIQVKLLELSWMPGFIP